MVFLLLAQLTFASWQPAVFPVLHQGYWRSCGEERVLEHMLNGKLLWELHLGPGDEFALFPGRNDDLGVDPHEGNLLTAPRGREFQTFRGARQWTVPALRLWISVVKAGDAPPECEAFFVKIAHQR